MTNWRSRPLALVLSIALLLLTKALIGSDHPWVAVECAIELALLACPAWAWSDGPPRAVWQAGPYPGATWKSSESARRVSRRSCQARR
jgi:hypothetical protein